MKINGTLMNYFFHCKRQCYLFGNRINLEDNSENVMIGRAIHEDKAKDNKNSELEIDNIKIDKLTSEYLTEIKKSDADESAAKWQLLYYLKVLKDKGIIRKGKLEFIEKNKSSSDKKSGKIEIFELSAESERELERHIADIEELLQQPDIPEVLNQPKCKKCAYYEYCYI